MYISFSNHLKEKKKQVTEYREIETKTWAWALVNQDECRQLSYMKE